MVVRALYGGSFDPVHTGHVAVVHHVLNSQLADWVHVVPAWQSPHKAETFATAAQRLDMVRLAWPDTPRVTIEEREIASPTPSFTYHTLDALRAAFPKDSWLLVIGADNLAEFHRWHEASKLLQMARLVVVGRQAQPLDSNSLRAIGLDPLETTVLPEFSVEVSASSLRHWIGKSELTVEKMADYGLQPKVAEYIIAHHLYRNTESPKESHRDCQD